MDTFRRKYGSIDPIYFALWEPDGSALVTGVTLDAGDMKISKDGGAFANVTGTFAEEGNGIYSYTPVAADNQCKAASYILVDVEAVCLDKAYVVETTHHPSAMHPEGVVAAGTVSSATSTTSITLPTGLTNLKKGAVLWITGGTGAGGSEIVFSYTSGTGATVLESPGLPTQPDNTSTFEAYFGPNPQAITTDENDAVIANVHYVNDVQLQGAGTSGDSMRPV